MIVFTLRSKEVAAVTSRPLMFHRRNTMTAMTNVGNYRAAVDSMMAHGAAALRLGESAEDAKILTDVAGRIQYMNLAAEQLLGIRFEQTRGRPLNTRGRPYW